jgi:hypothetical protein
MHALALCERPAARLGYLYNNPDNMDGIQRIAVGRTTTGGDRLQ